jgi:hypothetical protein
MNKETKKKLLSPFPEEVVQDPPKGKFGKYVNHAVYVERLRDSDVDYEWEFEPIIINDQVVGAIGKLTIDGKVYQGAGDVEHSALKRATIGECLKLAESDAFKRASMRAGLGVELWSGTDDFYMEDKQEPIEKTGRVKDIVIDQEEAVSKPDMSFDVGEPVNNAQEINEILKDMCPDEEQRKTLKDKAYKQVVSKSDFPTEVNEWSDAQVKDFIQLFADLKRPVDNVALIEETLGEVIDLTKNCPECGKSDYIEDNREKKASDPKFSKIPSWSCSNYKDNDGCGWTGWGDTDCPTEWL